MSSVLTGAARAAYSAAATVLSAAQISVGDEFLAVNVKEDYSGQLFTQSEREVHPIPDRMGQTRNISLSQDAMPRHC